MGEIFVKRVLKLIKLTRNHAILPTEFMNMMVDIVVPTYDKLADQCRLTYCRTTEPILEYVLGTKDNYCISQGRVRNPPRCSLEPTLWGQFLGHLTKRRAVFLVLGQYNECLII